jgi:hypothetical protein
MNMDDAFDDDVKVKKRKMIIAGLPETAVFD